MYDSSTASIAKARHGIAIYFPVLPSPAFGFGTLGFLWLETTCMPRLFVIV
jgi:hypothetical protein